MQAVENTEPLARNRHIEPRTHLVKKIILPCDAWVRRNYDLPLYSWCGKKKTAGPEHRTGRQNFVKRW